MRVALFWSEARSPCFSGLDEETLNSYKAGINQALEAGYEVLEKGGTSLDAVTSAVVILEDLPLFNAGKGSVYTSRDTEVCIHGNARKVDYKEGV